MKLLIIESNIVIRNVIKKLVTLFADEISEIYSVDNGTTGLGEILIQKPDLIVIDSQLSDLSTEEIIKHLNENQNKYLNFTYIQPIFLVNEDDEDLSDLYLKFNKSQAKFLENLLVLIAKNYQLRKECDLDGECSIRPITEKDGFFQSMYKKTCLFLGNRSIYFADHSDFIYRRNSTLKGLESIIGNIYWAGVQLATGSFLTLFDLMTFQVEDKNTKLYQKDKRHFRKEYYPQFATSFAVIAMLILQLFIYFFGSVFLSSRDPNFASASAETTMKWPGGGWKNRLKLTFNNINSKEDLINFPVLININSSRVNYSLTQNQGEDIRFTDSDGITIIPHDIEIWNETGISSVWVRVPQIDKNSVTDSIYMYYNNPSAPDGQNRLSVWGNSSYLGVWHFGSITNSVVSDLSPFAEDMKANGITNLDIKKGVSGNAVELSESKYLDQVKTNSPVYRFKQNQSYTISAWVNPSNESGIQEIISNDSSKTQTGTSLYLDYRADSPRTLGKAGFTSRKLTCCPAIYSYERLNAGNWYHIVAVRNGNDHEIYINGQISNRLFNFPSDDLSTSNELFFGRKPDGSNAFSGLLDEVRISTVPRSLGWNIAEYLSGTDQYIIFTSE